MNKIDSNLLAGKIEFDVELAYQVRFRANKWTWLRDLVANNIEPVDESSSRGWAKIPLVSKNEAVRGQQSVLVYVRERFPDVPWQLQTSITPGENGSFNLMLRKALKRNT
jgi:hypothetical protein